MAASGKISSSHNLHKHTSVETMEIVQSLLTAVQQCPTHHGHMVLLRIPSLALAAWAHRRLSRVRRQLGMEDSFEIILGNPSQALTIGQTFTDQIKVRCWLLIGFSLTQMLFEMQSVIILYTIYTDMCVNTLQIWLKIQDAEWVPHTYLELEALPCILILSGAEPLGESLPRYSLSFDC